jgi:carbamoyltransferase
MRILGISALDNDATASLYLDGQWRVIAEERLSRVKLHAGFPERAIRELFQGASLTPSDVDHVVYPFLSWWVEGWRILVSYLRDLPATLANGDPWGAKLRHLIQYAKWGIFAVIFHRRHHRNLVSQLRRLGLRRKLTRVDHHTAHAASAYFTSGYDQALGLTLDWYGSGLSGSVSRCTPDGIERIHEFRYPHSLGLFYGQVTMALGFKASRHEGKILGLAAYGDPHLLGPKALGRFVRRRGGDFRYRSAMDKRFVADLVKEFPREHVASAYQATLEVVVQELVSHWTRETGLQDIVLAGGVAANVKMNQRIAELDGVRRVFIHPNMGDGGTGVGASLALLSEHGLAKSEEWETCYLGSSFTEEEMQRALREAGLEPARAHDVPAEVARLLADGKIVARFDGAMEYGPRALGNRSILIAALDPAINDWLNERLGRTEFMPFAPVTLHEHRHERYLNVDASPEAVRFMTITCDSTPLMGHESPAAVHVDGTARPQIIRREDNEPYYRIVEEYHRLTGIPTLINTSFNMHEEPIVCTPQDAIRAFLEGGLDYLSLGPFLVPAPQEAVDTAQATRAGSA